ncbi:MAG: N-acetylmuramic acid 6-phosphate etherase [Planctomycetota bacterium]
MTLPPDRSHIGAEQRRDATRHIHRASISECLRLINDADREVADAVAAASPAIAAFLDDASQRFSSGGRLIYLGAGTSGRLGVLDASEAPPTFHVEPGRIVGIIAGGDNALRVSSEGREDDADGARSELATLNLTGQDAVLGIAAGGTTPYVLGALRYCDLLDERPLTGMLSCSQIDRPPGCDHLIIVDTGPEVVTGSTRMKAGTATKMVLNAISTTLMIRDGRVHENLMVDLRATNDKLLDRAIRIVCTLTSLDRDAAHELLVSADRNVKAALVMHHHGIELGPALAMLQRNDGLVHRALSDEPR